MFLLLLFLSFATSTVGSISGIGGGIILKPVLDAATTYDVSVINFLSSCTVLSMSILSLIKRPPDRTTIDKRRGIPLAMGAAIGGLLGKYLFSAWLNAVADTSHVATLQSIVLSLLTLGVIVYIKKKNKLRSPNLQSGTVCTLLGMVLGVMSSFLGIGGGPINVAAISFFLGMDMKSTALHGLLVIMTSQACGLSSTIVTGNMPTIDYYMLFPMITGAAVGASLGSRISIRMTNDSIEKLFEFVLVLVLLISGRNAIANLINFG